MRNSSLFRKNWHNNAELSFKYLRQLKQKKFSAHLCTESTQRRSVSLGVFARSLFRIGRGSTSFSHQKRIALFSTPSFCPSDHFTSAAEWQKFTRIGLGFAPDRLFCLLPPAPLSAYLSRQFQLECSRAIVVGGFDKRGGLLTDKLPIDNRSSSSATG